MTVLATPAAAVPPRHEVRRTLVDSLQRPAGHALVLTGARRSGKSTLQQQLRRRAGGAAVFCNLEDTRLYGLGPEDFPTVISVLDEHHAGAAVYLDEVQEAPEWQRLVRALLDAGRSVCVTGSNAALLGRELGAKLTGRHLSEEVYQISLAFMPWLEPTLRKMPKPLSVTDPSDWASTSIPLNIAEANGKLTGADE